MSSSIFSKVKRARAALNSSNRVEVTVHTAFEQHKTTQTTDHDSYNNIDEQAHERSNASGLDDDVERSV
jgi:hypothetical protein